MAVWDSKPLSSDKAIFQCNKIAGQAETILFTWAQETSVRDGSPIGFLGSVRALTALAPIQSTPPDGFAAEIEEKFLDWFDIKRSPHLDELERKEQRQSAVKCLEDLKAIAYKNPDPSWREYIDDARQDYLRRWPPLSATTEREQILDHVALPLNRVREWQTLLRKTRSADNGYLAAVMALRALVEGTGEDITLDADEVAAWRAAYEAWFKTNHKRFPKKIDPQEHRRYALEEFDKLLPFVGPAIDPELEAAAVKIARLSAIAQAKREAEKAEQAMKESKTTKAKPKPKAANPHAPCTLVDFPAADGSGTNYSMIFTAFEQTEPIAERHGFENDGYAWTELLKRHLASTPGGTGELSFDPESSMVSVVGPDAASLQPVAAFFGEVVVGRLELSDLTKDLPQD